MPMLANDPLGITDCIIRDREHLPFGRFVKSGDIANPKLGFSQIDRQQRRTVW